LTKEQRLATMTREDKFQVLELLEERSRRRLLAHIVALDPRYQAGWFHKEVCQRLDKFLQDVVAGKSPRLMLFAPPRHGKTEIVSRRFPSFALGRYPDLSIIAASYGTDLASRINRDVQRMIDDDGYHRLFPNSVLNGRNIRTVADGSWLRNSDVFEIVDHRGVYRSAGIGGGITGMGADVLIIDDPIKDAEQAYSVTYRDKVWEWYTSTAYTRVMPGGGVLIILTRWHEDDLAGRLLKAAEAGGEQWEIVSYPAIAEVDEKHRKIGEALHEERWNLQALERIKVAVGTRVWTALYQQRPAPLEGGLVKLAWFKRYSAPPSGVVRVIQSWDTAFKADQANDPSVCTTWAQTDTGYYLLDVWKQHAEYPELKRAAVSLAMKYDPTVILIEDKASGQSLVQDLKMGTSLPIVPVTPDGDKVIRLMAVSALMESGRVFLPEGAPWLTDYEAELATFPNAAHDDQVDSTSQALKYMAHGGGGMGAFEFMRMEAMEADRREAMGDDYEDEEDEVTAWL
jgi:predicted phage terminase large subunit-like protein